MTIIKTTVACLLATCAFTSLASAGGLERGGYNIDLLFDDGRFTAESGVVYVAPSRKLKNVTDTDTTNVPGGGNLGAFGYSDSTTETENYWIPRVGVKAELFDGFDCLADYSQPWGVHTKPGADWAGANDNIETKVYSDGYGLTCSYKFDLGPGKLRIIGGGFYQDIGGFKERLVLAPEIISGAGLTGTGVGRLNLETSGYGWRIGAAYEIPEYAMRVSLVYNSEVKLDDITGTLDLSQIPGAINPANTLLGLVTPVYGSSAMPETIELKLQSGIAPDWLAFGSVKWTDWSQLQSIPFYAKGTTTEVTSLDLAYRDGWTVSGGLGHKFTDQWSGAASVTWDRGTSQGFGSQTDTWTFGAGVAYTPTENVELRLAGALSILTSGSSGTIVSNGTTYGDKTSYDFDNDIAAAISTSLKVRF